MTNPQQGDLQQSSGSHGFAVEPVTDPANYLDTQTLAGGDGYFHTENAPTHATDGTAQGQSPETPLVAQSRATTTASVSTPEGDGLDEMTNSELRDLADAQGIDVAPRANKAALITALRGE